MKVLQLEESRKTKFILHAYDRKILALLCRNVRFPLSKIAHVLRLSRQSVEYRINVMEREHLLAGSRAVINIRKLGYHSYHYFLTLHDTRAEQQLIERALASKDVNALISYSGKLNYELSLMAPEPRDAQQHFHTLIASLPVTYFTPCIILNTIKAEVLPLLASEHLPTLRYIRNDPSFSRQFELPELSYMPDNVDRELLFLLSQHAQLSLSELGRKLHLSRDVVSYRIKKLIRARYLLEFRPVINYESLSYTVQALLIKANRSPLADKHFQAALLQNKAVLWATELFGYWDYLIYTLTHEREEVHECIRTLAQTFPAYLVSYELLFAFREHKYAFMTEAMRKA